MEPVLGNDETDGSVLLCATEVLNLNGTTEELSFVHIERSSQHTHILRRQVLGGRDENDAGNIGELRNTHPVVVTGSANCKLVDDFLFLGNIVLQSRFVKINLAGILRHRDVAVDFERVNITASVCKCEKLCTCLCLFVNHRGDESTLNCIDGVVETLVRVERTLQKHIGDRSLYALLKVDAVVVCVDAGRLNTEHIVIGRSVASRPVDNLQLVCENLFDRIAVFSHLFVNIRQRVLCLGRLNGADNYRVDKRGTELVELRVILFNCSEKLSRVFSRRLRNQSLHVCRHRVVCCLSTSQTLLSSSCFCSQ